MLPQTSSSKIIYTFTAGNSITAGDLVYLSGADTVSKYANNTNADLIVGVALETKSSGSIRVQVPSVGQKISIYSGLTAGARYAYNASGALATTYAGAFWDIGVAINTTTILVMNTLSGYNIKNKDLAGTYDPSTDSLEAISDAWPYIRKTALVGSSTVTASGKGIFHTMIAKSASGTITATVTLDGVQVITGGVGTSYAIPYHGGGGSASTPAFGAPAGIGSVGDAAYFTNAGMYFKSSASFTLSGSGDGFAYYSMF